jgi:exonuclease III
MTAGIAYWQPRVMRHTLADGSVEYAIHDVYFGKDGSVVTYTEHARSARMSSVAELESWIRALLAEGSVAVECGDLGYMHSAEDHLRHWLEHIHDPPIDDNM